MTTPGNPSDSPSDTSGAPGTDAERIVADIEATRAELGETVDVLAGKLDVRAQARNQVDDVRERAAQQVATVRDAATDDRGDPTTAAKGVAGGIVAVIVCVVLLRVLRRRKGEER